MADNRATVEITASTRDLDARLRDALNKFVTFANSVDKTAKKHRGGSGALGSFLGNVGANIATRGLDALRDAGGEVIDYERKMTRLQIAANRTTAEMLPFRNAVRAASEETGQSRESILSAASTYVALTGDMKGAESQTREFARVATASGASIEDVAQAGVAMQQALKLDPAQMDAAFSSMIVQGKAGAIELKDVAAEMSSVAPQFAKFAGGTGLDGVRQLGTALQIVRKEFKGSAETATGLRALMTALTQNARKFKAAGVNVFTTDSKGVKHLKSFREIIDLIGESKLAKDPTKLTRAFGSSEALRAYQALTSVTGEWENIYTAAQDAGAVTRDFNTYAASDAGRLDAAMNKLKLSIADAFTPERIQAFVSAVESLASKIGPVIDGMAKAASLTYGLGKSAGEYIRGVFTSNNPYAHANALAAQYNSVGYAEGYNVEDQSPEAKAKRARKASSAIASFNQWESAASSIVDAQDGDNRTSESIRRAMAYYYQGKAGAQANPFGGDSGALLAGSQYLSDAKVRLPDEIATQAGLKVQIALITEAIKAGFAGAQMNLHTENGKIAKASNEGRSRSHP